MSEIIRKSTSRRGLIQGAGLAAAIGGIAALTACTSEKTAVAAGGETAASAGVQAGKKVVFVVHDKNPFFAPVQAGFEDFGKAMGWETQFVGPPQQDVQATVDMQTNAINGKPDGLILTRIDEKAFDANIQRALDEGIAVALSNVAGVDYEKFRIGFVGQSFVRAGTEAGMLIAQYAEERSGKRDGVIIAGNFGPGNSALEERVEGIKLGVDKYNKEYGTTFTVEVLVTSTDETKAVGAIDARYRKEPVVGWAMAAFDHQFVSTWAKNNNLTGKFGVGGFDLTAPVLAGIEDGSIDFSLGQNPYAQGWMAAAMIAEEIGAGFPGSLVDTGAEIADAENIKVITEREARYA